MLRTLVGLSTCAILFACSANIVEISAPVSIVDADDSIYRLEQGLTIKVSHAAPVVLRPGTTWTKIGTIEQGVIFDTQDQVVIVNSFDVHEAAVVTNDSNIVGFYLKAQKSFVAANPVPITLQLRE